MSQLRRIATLIAICGFNCILVAQDNLFFEGSRPDAVITIHKDTAMNVEIVDVVMLDPEYPPDLLGKQMADLGARMGDGPRALQVSGTQSDPKNPKSKFISARFGMAGIIGVDKLRLNPIAQCFAADSQHPVKEISVVFEGLKPSGKLVQEFSSDAVALKAQVIPTPPTIEYRIRLLSKDPAKINIPDQYNKPDDIKAHDSKVSERKLSPIFIAGGILGAVALGLLVYFLSLAKFGRK